MLECDPETLGNTFSVHAVSLTIRFAQHNIDAAQNGDYIRHLMPCTHRSQSRQVDEAGRADVIAPGVLGAFFVTRRYDIVTEFALRILDPSVRFTNRYTGCMLFRACENRFAVR